MRPDALETRSFKLWICCVYDPKRCIPRKRSSDLRHSCDQRIVVTHGLRTAINELCCRPRESRGPSILANTTAPSSCYPDNIMHHSDYRTTFRQDLSLFLCTHCLALHLFACHDALAEDAAKAGQQDPESPTSRTSEDLSGPFSLYSPFPQFPIGADVVMSPIPRGPSFLFKARVGAAVVSKVPTRMGQRRGVLSPQSPVSSDLPNQGPAGPPMVPYHGVFQ